MSTKTLTLAEEKQSHINEARRIVSEAKAAGRDLTHEEATAFDQHMDEVDALQSKMNDANAAKARRQRLAAIDHDGDDTDDGGDSDAGQAFAKSLGEHFVLHAKDRLAAVAGHRQKFDIATPEFKLATDVQVTPAGGAGLSPLVTQFDTNIVQGLRRRLTVNDLLPQGTLGGNALTYFIEGAFEGAFTTVAESAQKPQMHVADPTSVTEGLKKIAGFIKESDEMVEDFPFLVSAINNRLLYNLALFEEDQLLNGNGTGTNIRGLLQRSGIQTLGVGTDPKAGNLDTIFKGITSVETGSGFFADGIVINPTDYQTFRLTKDANSQYYGGGPFTGQYGVGGILERPPLWGVRTVVTPAITAGTVLIGAFTPAAEVLRKGGVGVATTNSDGTDFQFNRITIRAEERLLLAVRYPAALVKVTLGTT